MDAQKQCRTCGVMKPLSEFQKDKQCRQGARPDCKKCRSKPREYIRDLSVSEVFPYCPPECIEKFLSRIVPAGDCLMWAGPRNRDGYGIFSCQQEGLHQGAHRWAYLWGFGSIPEGLELDHLCRNRGCVNPKHLEAVSHQENIKRSAWGERNSFTETCCPKGHNYEEAGFYVSYYKDGRPKQRECKICASDRGRIRYLKKRGRVL